jgi:hypothetical protein
MQKDELILAEEFCNYYKVEYSFIDELEKFGLIEMTSVEAQHYIQQSQLLKLEQMIRLYYDLNINLEGIDAIAHLIERVKMMQNEITELKNRLKLYEDFE